MKIRQLVLFVVMSLLMVIPVSAQSEDHFVFDGTPIEVEFNVPTDVMVDYQAFGIATVTYGNGENDGDHPRMDGDDIVYLNVKTLSIVAIPELTDEPFASDDQAGEFLIVRIPANSPSRYLRVIRSSEDIGLELEYEILPSEVETILLLRQVISAEFIDALSDNPDVRKVDVLMFDGEDRLFEAKRQTVIVCTNDQKCSVGWVENDKGMEWAMWLESANRVHIVIPQGSRDVMTTLDNCDVDEHLDKVAYYTPMSHIVRVGTDSFGFEFDDHLIEENTCD